MNRTTIYGALAALLVGAGLWYRRKVDQEGGDPSAVDVGGVGGTPGNPLLNGSPVDGRTAPKDTPEAMAIDQYVIVRGDTRRGAVARDLPIFSLENTRQAWTAFGDRFGLKFPHNIVYYYHGKIFPSVDPVFVAAILRTENSGYDPEAETYEANVKDYSIGLAQIRVDTAKWMVPEWNGLTADEVRTHLKNPAINIAVCFRFVYYQMARYSDPELHRLQPREAWMAAGYNGGSAFYNFQRKLFTNQTYVNRVIGNMSALANAFPTRKGTV